MKKLLLYSSLVFSPFAFAQVTNTTFNFTGSMQTFTVPACVTTVTITCYGAQGQSCSPGGTGGLGGHAVGELSVTAGQTLNIFVGGQNGYNGGGIAGVNGNSESSGGLSVGPAGNGGGGSDVRVGGTTINDRIIVAGGGGGAGHNGVWNGCQTAGPAGNGGDGGGLIGSAGTFGVGTPCNCQGGGGAGGQGGTQSAGGVHGNYNGNTACLRSSWTAGQDGTLYQGGQGSVTYHNGTGGGGGGGGGYYGGGSGGSGSDTTPGGGGGGGSSWTGTLTSDSTTAGVRTGDGMITISYSVSGSVPATPVNFYTTNACEGGIFTMSTDSIPTATSYTWIMPAGWTIISGQGTTTITAQAGVSSATPIEMYASNACGDGPSAYITANALPNPTVDLGPDTAGCTSITLTADSSTTYLWCSAQTTQSIVATISGGYCVTITDQFGCSGSDTINVTIYPNPTVVASAAMNFVCASDDTVQLFGSPSGGTFSGPGVIPGDEFDPVSAGVGVHDVIYTYTDANGCTGMDTTTITVDVCTGIMANTILNFSVTPNPATDFCQVNFTSDQSAVLFEVRDVQGRIVKSQSASSVSAGTPVVLDLTGIANGIYTLHVISNGAESVRKLQIQ